MTDVDLTTLTLDKGGHSDPSDGACLLEAAALLAGEPFTDHPQCVSPVLASYGRQLNDALPDDTRQQLKPFTPRLLNTAGDGFDETRGYLALDWLIRTYTPAWLDLAGFSAEATALRALPRIADLAAAEAAGPVVRESEKRASTAISAAYSAARSTAISATDSAADSALAPTVTHLQQSAIELFDRMIDGRWDA